MSTGYDRHVHAHTQKSLFHKPSRECQKKFSFTETFLINGAPELMTEMFTGPEIGNDTNCVMSLIFRCDLYKISKKTDLLIKTNVRKPLKTP